MLRYRAVECSRPFYGLEDDIGKNFEEELRKPFDKHLIAVFAPSAGGRRCASLRGLHGAFHKCVVDGVVNTE
ncbi:hypothetical protein ABZP36_014497 [Zizania latifolia]